MAILNFGRRELVGINQSLQDEIELQKKLCKKYPRDSNIYDNHIIVLEKALEKIRISISKEKSATEENSFKLELSHNDLKVLIGAIRVAQSSINEIIVRTKIPKVEEEYKESQFNLKMLISKILEQSFEWRKQRT